jgi:hypothetical protein
VVAVAVLVLLDKTAHLHQIKVVTEGLELHHLFQGHRLLMLAVVVVVVFQAQQQLAQVVQVVEEMVI